MSTNVSLELIGKFIGGNEIESTVLSDQKTPSGNDIVEVTFKGGMMVIYPVSVLEYIVTDEVSNATAVMEKKMLPLRREIMMLLAEYDLAIGEIEFLFKYIGGDIDNGFDRAKNYLWFKDDSRFVSGMNPELGVSLLMADKILKEIQDGGKNTK